MAKNAERTSTTATSLWLRLARALLLGVPMALAPFLGIKVIPGFEPLAAVLSQDLRAQVLPYSIALASAIAVVLEFYVREKIRAGALRWIFPLLVVILLVGGGFLLSLQTRHIRLVPISAERSTAFVVTPTRQPTCGCGPLGDMACIKQLSFDPVAIESCWSGPEVESARLRLMGTYLLVVGALLSLLGVLVLRMLSREPRSTQQPAKRRRSVG